MQVSILKCVLNTEWMASMDVIAQMGAMKYLWRIYVDDELVGERAIPIGLFDDWAELEADEQYPIRGDGDKHVLIREFGSYVIWFNPLGIDAFPTTYHPGLEQGRVIVFERGQYLQAIETCLRQAPPIQLDTTHRPTKLRELSQEELSKILDVAFPDVESPIYTVPELPDDPQGWKLLKAVKRCLIANPSSQIAVCDEPQEIMEVRIGLELLDYPEALWKLGRIGNNLAVYFESWPQFPLWLCGKDITEAMAHINRLWEAS